MSTYPLPSKNADTSECKHFETAGELFSSLVCMILQLAKIAHKRSMNDFRE